MRKHRSMSLGGLALALLLIIAGVAGCAPPPDTYVALGDSFTAGPLIPNQSLEPLGCMRSDQNYAQIARSQVHAAKFKDVSCSGATLNRLYSPHNVTPGPANPPQLEALDDNTKIVTLGMGGNDIGFSDIVKTCALQNPFGDGCKGDYVHDGRDELRERIAEVSIEMRQAIDDIRAAAPRARIFVVGYPTIVPHTGSGCYPQLPILPSDVPYLRGIAQALNSMLWSAAYHKGAAYIDVYAPSIGHDACASSSTRWVEGLIPSSAAAPVHPNGRGMRAMGDIVAARINTIVSS